MTLVVDGNLNSNGNSNPVGVPSPGAKGRGRVGPRARVDRSVWSRVRAAAPLDGHPKSIREMVAYTRAGGWVPGDRAGWVESIGYVWGCVVAVPASIVMYSVLWVVQHFTHVMMVGIVYGLLLWSGVDVLTGGWWRAVEVWLVVALVSTMLVLLEKPPAVPVDSVSRGPKLRGLKTGGVV